MPLRLEEEAPFLTDNEEVLEDTANQHGQTEAASYYSKLALRLLAIIMTIQTTVVLGLLIGAYVKIKRGPFSNKGKTLSCIREMCIVVFVNLLIIIPTIFISISTIFLCFAGSAMFFTILTFTIRLLDHGVPERELCPGQTSNTGFWTPDMNCLFAAGGIDPMVGAGGIISVGITILTLISLTIRLVTLHRTGFWKRIEISRLARLLQTPRTSVTPFNLRVIPPEQSPKDRHNRWEGEELI